VLITATPISSSLRVLALNHSTASGLVKSTAALGLAKPCTSARPPPCPPPEGDGEDDLLFIRKPRRSPSARISESSGTYGLTHRLKRNPSAFSSAIIPSASGKADSSHSRSPWCPSW